MGLKFLVFRALTYPRRRGRRRSSLPAAPGL